jgi:integrase
MITEKQAADAKPDAQRDVYIHDDGPGSVRGFALRIRASGARTFELRVRVRGRVQRLKVGNYSRADAGGVARARRRAAELRGQIADGHDPAAERREQRRLADEKRAEPTFGDLTERWLDAARTGLGRGGRREGRPKRTWIQDKHNLARYVPDWASLRLDAITVAVVRQRIGEVARHAPYAGNRLGALLQAMFRFAVREGLVVADPTVGRPVAPEHARERFLSDIEAGRFLAAIDAEEDVRWKTYLLLLVSIGVRRGELLALRWANVHLGEGARIDLVAATTKSGRARSLPLSPDAVRALQGLADDPQHGRREDGFVFHSPHSRSGHLVEHRRPWERALEHAGLSDVRPHDLRRTLGSWLASSGVSLTIVGEVLGHNSLAVTKNHYSRIALDSQRSVLDSHAERLQAARDAHEEKVRPLRGKVSSATK